MQKIMLCGKPIPGVVGFEPAYSPPPPPPPPTPTPTPTAALMREYVCTWSTYTAILGFSEPLRLFDDATLPTLDPLSRLMCH